MIDVHVGERIRELREIQNYTREGFAEKVDISAKFLYEIETGKKGFSAETLSRISVALSVSCDYIMFGENTENEESGKLKYILAKMKPTQIYKIRHILQILYEMCDLE